MSNQDPFNQDKNKADYWGSTRDWATTEETGNQESIGDFGQTNLDNANATADQLTGKAASVADEGKHKAHEMAEKAKTVADEGMHKAEEMADKAKHAAEDSKQKVGEMAGKAQERADEGIDKAAESMDKAAEMVRQKGNEQGGTVGSVAGTAADAMESASAFLRDTDTGQMMDQLETYIRKNPTQSLLIAAGVGLVLSKAFR